MRGKTNRNRTIDKNIGEMSKEIASIENKLNYMLVNVYMPI